WRHRKWLWCGLRETDRSFASACPGKGLGSTAAPSPRARELLWQRREELSGQCCEAESSCTSQFGGKTREHKSFRALREKKYLRGGPCASRARAGPEPYHSLGQAGKIG